MAPGSLSEAALAESPDTVPSAWGIFPRAMMHLLRIEGLGTMHASAVEVYANHGAVAVCLTTPKPCAVVGNVVVSIYVASVHTPCSLHITLHPSQHLTTAYDLLAERKPLRSAKMTPTPKSRPKRASGVCSRKIAGGQGTQAWRNTRSSNASEPSSNQPGGAAKRAEDAELREGGREEDQCEQERPK